MIETQEAALNHYPNLAQSRRNVLTDKKPNESAVNSDTTENQPTVPTSKRKFVEPEISQPVDVLEATTFFQAVDSGPTN
jgi:hypothetical protein